MKTKKGFTVIEIIIVGVFAGIVLLFFFLQQQTVKAMKRDEQRKIATNAIYYALEESFYKQNGYYPEQISEENITVIDPALWTDPNGVNLGEVGSNYHYEPANCDQGKCQEYVLRTEMERENTYTKYSRN